jgi:hypothetical protein
VTIIAQSSSAADGLSRVARFVRCDVGEYGDPKCYDVVEDGIESAAFRDAVDWTVEGISRLPPSNRWDLSILDLGDYPDSFHLRRHGSQDDWNEVILRQQFFGVSVGRRRMPNLPRRGDPSTAAHRQ